MYSLSYDALRHARVPLQLLLVVLFHFCFERSQLFTNGIIRFQFCKLLIQRFLFAKAVAFGFRFHVIDTAFEGFKTRHRFINFAAIKLTTNITRRASRLMTQRERLLTSARFAEFVFQLRDLFLHAGSMFHPPA
ncbi:Uncharacterised protein [Lelliottia amnigena]|nr:Uncharacterised protein [Lelliottia amnigena]